MTKKHGYGMMKKGIWTLLILAGSSLAGPNLLSASSLSDEPMETKIQTAPPIVMFTLDNSGSMDWEVIVEDGVFGGHEYLYSPGDNAYYESSSNGNVIGYGDATEKLAWKSQWSDYNKIYYNPHSNYEPWPDWENMVNTEGSPNHLADLVNPRSNPIHSGVTQNIHVDFYPNLPTANYVVADNGNSDDFSTTGSWTESSPTPEWLGSSVYTNNLDATATFTPLISQAGDYEIYAYWNCYNDRDQNALITVDSNNDGTPDASERVDQHATTNNTPETGACGEWLPLFGGSGFTFPSGRVGSVSITRDASSTGSSTIADAIAFVPVGSGGPSSSTMDIKLAHYYITNDENDNQIPEYGEVYLVNFVWTDDNSNSQVDDGEVVRDYYLPYFTGTDKYQRIQYATPVNSVPDAIIPKNFNEDGSTTNKTAIEDLQNFANWFSFYRRRELTAKAAISRTIADLDNVYVGYYTINSGLRQTVLPINVADDSIIVSAGDSEESRSSGWSSSGRSPQHEGDAYYTGSTAWMEFAPNLTAGDYTVYGWWPCNNSSDRNAQISIAHASGTTDLYVNQQSPYNDTMNKESDCFDSSGDGCCGYWVDLGSYTFDSGTTGTVTVERTASSTDDYTYANAVKFVGGGTTTVNKLDTLLDGLYGVDSGGGTPLRSALQNIGRYYHQDDGNDGNLGASPFYTEAKGGACQQSYAIVMSDGYWNGYTPSGIGNQDQGEGAPYEDGWSDTLADVAWKYYDTDLSDALPDEMATNNWDKRTSQHMVTFSIAFGLDGNLDKLDLDGDGVQDDPSCIDDPYFLDPNTPTPTWPNPTASEPNKIDDMWHAAVNGRGEFFSAKNPDTLVATLTDLFSNIAARAASGASVSVNGNALTSTIALFQSSYTSGSWEGDVTSYPININTGEVLRDEASIKWRASEQLQGQDWDTGRTIVTYDGTDGQPFRSTDLTENQNRALLQEQDAVDYIRGKEIDGFRSRTQKLGDIVHSAPLLVPAAFPETDNIDNNNNGSVDEEDETGGIIFAGGNDGMLHAFDADTGSEVMAYVPHHNYYRLHDLTDIDYKHRFFVDATPSYKRMNFMAGDQTADGVDNDGDGCFDADKDVEDLTYCDESANGDDEDYSDGVDNNGDGEVDEAWETKKVTMLVGGLNKGGKGIYALNITDIESAAAASKTEAELSDMVMWEFPSVPTYTYGADQTNDGVDNDLDNTIDEADEDYSDTLDNDGDGITDEEGELIYTGTDDDMGYSFSAPFIVKSYKSGNEQYDSGDSPWVVIFGNGYESVNGSAVLYIVDAFTGTLVRKIDTGATGSNGLSETAVVDVDNDDRVDYVYAGDLKGNMWKFDLTDPDPDNWGVAFGEDNYNPIAGKERIDAADSDGGTPPLADVPQPLFRAVGQPITAAPDVMHHPKYGEEGYLVVFGTGKFLAEADRTDNTQQAIYSIWDYGTDPSNYLGELQADDTLSNLTTAQLLEQTEIDFRYYAPTSNWLRTLSDNTINWYTSDDCRDGDDNDNDGSTDEADEICGVPISPSTYQSDGIDNNLDGEVDEPGEEIGHAGWYFKLPFGLHYGSDSTDNDGDGTVDEADEAKLAGERVIKNIIIRDGRAIVISFIPDDSPCSGGGNSILHEMRADSGGRFDRPVFDVNNDGVVDDNDMITITIDGEEVSVAPTGRKFGGMLHTPAIVDDPSNSRELKFFSTSAGTIETVAEKQEEDGIFYWRER